MQIKIFLEICFGKNFILQVQRVKRFKSKSSRSPKVIQGQRKIKVILTVRESDERWWKSWCGFMNQEIDRFAFGDLQLGAIFNEGPDLILKPE